MRKSQKVERLGFSFSSPFPVLLGKSPELDPARLVWVKFQPESPQPFPKIFQKTIRIASMLKAQYVVVRIADDNDLALRTLSAPDIHPQVEHVMQIDVRKQR